MLSTTTPAPGGRATADWAQQVSSAGFLGEASDVSDHLVMTSVGGQTLYPVAAGQVAVTLSRTRRVKVTVAGAYNLRTTYAGALLRPAYWPAASPSSVVLGSAYNYLWLYQANSTSPGSLTASCSFLLPAGSYVFTGGFSVVYAGSTSDFIDHVYVLAEDIGAN